MNESQEVRVYQNIEESPIYYDYENFRFYFSSSFYRKNFKTRIEAYINDETYKIRNRYKIFNEKFFDLLKEVLLISYYKKIEKRGFKVYLNEERYKEDGK